MPSFDLTKGNVHRWKKTQGYD